MGVTGAIEKIFFHDEFVLDAATGQVSLSSEPIMNYHLVGDQNAIIWTQKALKRIGCGFSEEGTKIKVAIQAGIIHWEVLEDKGATIEGLLHILKKE